MARGYGILQRQHGDFLSNAMGYCLVQDDEILAGAYASSLGEKYAEIGAVTHTAYQGLGDAPIACAFLIEALRACGFWPYWSCGVDNIPSLRTAQKLGISKKQAYEFFEYRATSA
jgi:hypothetical protein